MMPAGLAELKESAAEMAGRLKLMSHPERLLMLCRMGESEVSVSELVALSGLSQSAVSQHLAMLRRAGVVRIRKDAQVRYYKLQDPVVQDVIHTLCWLCSGSRVTPAP